MSAASLSSVTAADLDMAEVLGLYRSVGWTAYANQPEVLQAALAGSSHVVTARVGPALVGLARVVSDSASIAYLQDVLVDPAQQRRGIGAALIAAAFAPYEGVRQKVLLTDDAPEQRAFYTALGWREADQSGLRAFIRFDDPAQSSGA